MIIPFRFNTDSKIPNLDQMLERQSKEGGMIVGYPRVYSAVTVTVRNYEFEWAPDLKASRKSGRKHAAVCALLGWWSLPGFIVTPFLIWRNLRGGVDFTEAILAPPLLPEAAAAQKKAANRQDLYVLGFFLIIFVTVAAVLWFR